MPNTLSACRPPDNDNDNDTDNKTTLPTLVSTVPADTASAVSIVALEFTLSTALEVDRRHNVFQLKYLSTGESQAYMVSGTVRSLAPAVNRFAPNQPFGAGQYTATSPELTGLDGSAGWPAYMVGNANRGQVD